jgi:hypothetical protein
MTDLRISNYASLQASVIRWLNRDDLTDEVPLFIQLAEEMFDDEIRWHKAAVRDVAVADEMYEELPADFVELKSIRFDTVPVIRPKYRTPAQLEELRQTNSTLGGTPLFYTIIGQQILFDRVPTGSPNLELESFVRTPPLATNSSNLLLQEHPGIYLFGSLMQSAPFLKNDARLATWTALYQERRNALNSASKRSEAPPGEIAALSTRKPFG